MTGLISPEKNLPLSAALYFECLVTRSERIGRPLVAVGDGTVKKTTFKARRAVIFERLSVAVLILFTPPGQGVRGGGVPLLLHFCFFSSDCTSGGLLWCNCCSATWKEGALWWLKGTLMSLTPHHYQNGFSFIKKYLHR